MINTYSMMADNVVLSFGVIADVQYADIDDAYNYSKTKIRHYRNALNLLDSAVFHWLKHKPTLSFVLQLGDLIDGFNRREKASKSALKTVTDIFNRLPCTTLHSLGNHDFYNFKRDEIYRSTLYSAGLRECQADEGVAYYTYQPHPQLIVVAMDTYEVSTLGYQECDENFKRATKILETHNPNSSKLEGTGLHGLDRRYVAFNGGITDEQLDWLKRILRSAEMNRVNVIVTAHAPCYHDNVDIICLPWNCDAILDALHEHSSCVVCYLAGHDHQGGYAVDDHQIHHLTLPAVVEAEIDSNAFASVDVYPDRMEFVGTGHVQSFAIPLRYAI